MSAMRSRNWNSGTLIAGLHRAIKYPKPDHQTEYDLCQQTTSVQMQILLDITRISKVLKLKDDQNQTNRISYKETNICIPQWEIQNVEHPLEIKEKE